MNLISDWYALDEEAHVHVLKALRFIESSIHRQKKMEQARDALVRAVLDCEMDDRPSEAVENAESVLLYEYEAALDVFSNASIIAIGLLEGIVRPDQYLYEFDEGTDEGKSMPRTLGDDSANDLKRRLAERGLRFETDDIGWLVKSEEKS